MKRLIAIVLAFVMLLGLTACGKQAAPAQTAPTETTPPPTMEAYVPPVKTLYVLIPDTGDEWDDEAARLAVEAVEKLQAEGSLAVETVSYDSVEAQIQCLEEIAAAGTGDGSQGVVLMPEDETVADALQKLLEANISYALADVIPESAAAASVTNVYYDQRLIGAAAAAYLTDAGLRQKNDVVIIQGITEADAQKTEGFKLYLEGKLEVNGKTIETPWGSFATLAYSDMEAPTREGAKNYFETYMEDGDRAWTGYFASWDDEFLLGVLDALKDEYISDENRGRLYDMEPVFTGFGPSTELCEILEHAAQAEETGEYTYLDEILYELRDMNSMVYDASMLAMATEAMAAHMAGEVVPQEQILNVAWWREPPVQEETEE